MKFAALVFICPLLAQVSAQVPDHVPPKRSSQIENGFGINSDLPRDPFLPWDRWWWTRMFDAGVSWIRIGQYENSSDPTSWDWVEQKRGVFEIAAEVDDYVDSLIENGVKVQVQLMYGNPLYTGPAGVKPDHITPKPGGFHNDDRSIDSIFWPPKSPAEIEAFLRYVKWIVNHFKGRIKYYALWNEQDIGYWNPWGNPEEYGRLLAAFAPAVHQADPQAKVIYGGQADPVSDFAKRALDECKCASQIDVFAYHTYPGYGQNMHPESMDFGAYGVETTIKLRQTARGAIGHDVEFWDDEFNSIPSWPGSDESVQSKYIPRGILYNHAAGVRTFVWLLAAGVDGNEYDDFGFIHGKRGLADDFTPRPVYFALQNTNALFADTKLDTSIKIDAANVPQSRANEFLHYGFRNRNGKAIVAYWLAAHSVPGDVFPPLTVDLTLPDIKNPVLIDVVSGKITPLNSLKSLPLRDSVMAIADASYFDWPVLPEAPSGLVAQGTSLKWELHGARKSVVERRIGNTGRWERVAMIVGSSFNDTKAPSGVICYRVRAVNDAGESAYSNIARIRH